MSDLRAWLPAPSYVDAWIRAFVFTQLVEAPLYVLLARTRPLKALSLSLVTHPPLWFLFWLHVRMPYAHKLIVGELCVLAVESALLFLYERPRLSFARALGIAAIANLASVVLGELCRALFGIP